MLTELGNCSLTNYIHLKYYLEDLGDPVGEENDKKANNSAGDLFFAFFLRLFISCPCEHGKSSHDKHAKENEAGEGEYIGQKAAENPA